MNRCPRCSNSETTFSFSNEDGKCPRCGYEYYIEPILHPIGSESIDFSELNMGDPSVLRMYFGKHKNVRRLGQPIR